MKIESSAVDPLINKYREQFIQSITDEQQLSSSIKERVQLLQSIERQRDNFHKQLIDR